MNDNSPPVPSGKSLVLASVLALLFAVLILFSIVLPAEYGIDPTGLGAKIGLTALAGPSDAKPVAVSCPDPASASSDNVKGSATQTPPWKHTVMIAVPAGKGLEYKFSVAKGAVLEYAWFTDGGKLYFDFHGEPKGDTTGYFKSYKETTDRKSSGALTAPFEGSHGWYWENRSRQPVIVSLSTRGNYSIIGLK